MRCAKCRGAGETTAGLCMSCLGTGFVGISSGENHPAVIENTGLRAEITRLRSDLSTALARNAEIEGETQRLRDALSVLADPAQWTDRKWVDPHTGLFDVVLFARTAIKQEVK